MTAHIVPVLVSIDNGDAGVRYAIVPSYGGAYAAGEDGSIWSCVKLGGQVRVLTRSWRKLASSPLNGYPNITIRQPDTGKYRPFPVHLMVAEAWHGPCPAGLECRHKNDVRTDNRETNLVWGTHSENMLDRGINGDPTFRGNDHPQAILTETIVLELRRLVREGATVKHAASACGVEIECAYGAVRGRSWSHLPGAIQSYERTSEETKDELSQLASQGLSLHQIIERTGLPYMTVYNHVVRRERRLRQIAEGQPLPQSPPSDPIQRTMF